MSKRILCMDFDGVIHSYSSGWVQADFIPDPPVPGAFVFLYEAQKHFDVQIFSSRSHQDGGIRAMRIWMEYWAKKELTNEAPHYKANTIINQITWRNEAWPKVKPSAFITIDDRAVTFTGMWPDPETLLDFKPWNK